MVVIPTERPERPKWMDEPDRPVTQGMRHWQLMMAENRARPTVEAAEWAAEQIRHMAEGGAMRAGRLSPSALHTCERAQMLSYAGNKGVFGDKSMVLMEMGTWSHLRWQVAGLSEGFLSHAEVVVLNSGIDSRIWGHMDGVVSDGSGFELKTTSQNNYSWVSVKGPSSYHVHQIGVYMLLSGLDTFSLVYEARDDGEFFEVRLTQEDVDLDSIKERVDTMLTWADSYDERSEMPPVKPLCLEHKGKEYNSCPLRFICLPSAQTPSTRGGAT